MTTLNASNSTFGLDYQSWINVPNDVVNNTANETVVKSATQFAELFSDGWRIDYFGTFSDYQPVDGTTVEYPFSSLVTSIAATNQGASVLDWTGLLWNPMEEMHDNPNASMLSGNDTISGGLAADCLAGFTGNDAINGGGGLDNAHYFANRSAYSVTKATDGWSVSGGTDGADTLTNIERLKFSDCNVALDIDGNAGKVAKILGAVFGAAAVSNKEYAGIGLELIDGGMTYETLAGFAIGATGKSTSQDIVTLLWTNLMGSAPSTAEAQPFIDMLNSGMSTGTLGVMASDHAALIGVVDLAGLGQTGLEYV